MAADAIQNILLKITGDSSEARDELLRVARQVEQFDSAEGKATADVDAEPARRTLRDLVRQVRDLARERASVRVDADTVAATTGLDRVAAKADVLDAKRVDVEVDVDADRAGRGLGGFVRSLGGLFRQAGKVNNALGELSGAGFGAVAESAGFASTSVGTSGGAMTLTGKAAAALAAIVGPILVAALGSAAVAAAVLGASLTLAAGALGALAAGFGALLVPAVALGVGAVDRFKETVDKAGSPANALREAFEGFRDVFRDAVAPGADAVFTALAGALKTLAPLVKSVGPAFAVLGKAVGDAIGTLAREFARPEWIAFFGDLFATAAQVLPALADLFVGVLRVARNLVDATLPLLAPLLQGAADAVNSFAKGAGSAQGFSRFLAAAVPHLQSWWDLLTAVSDVFLSFVTVAAPFGKQLVDFFAEGARNLADWVKSAEGSDQIKRFFEDTLPLVKQVVIFFARLAVIALQAFQAVAPALTGIFQVLNFGLGLISKLLGLFNQLSPVVRGIIVPFAGFASILTNLSTLIGNVLPAIKELASSLGTGLLSAVGTAGDAAKAVVEKIVSTVKAGATGALNAAKAVGQAIADGIKSLGTAIADTATGVALGAIRAVRTFIANALETGKDLMRNVKNGIVAIATSVAAGAASVAVGAVRAVRTFISNMLETGRDLMRNVRDGIGAIAGAVAGKAAEVAVGAVRAVRDFIGNMLESGKDLIRAVRDGVGDLAASVADKAKAAAEKAADAVKGVAGAFEAAGAALVKALAKGIADAASAAVDAVVDLAGKLKSKLPFSEPKDPSSPLRGLGKAGEAFVGNFMAGIAKAAPRLNAAVTDALGSVAMTASLSAAGGVPAVNVPAMLASQPGPTTQNHTWNVPMDIPYYSPQSQAQMALAHLEMMISNRGGLGV